MPIYKLEGPDGRRYTIEGPAGATPDDLEAAIRSHAPPERSTTERLWEGVKGGASRMRDELLPPGNPLTLFDRDQAAAGQQVRDRKANLAHYEATKGELGTAGAIGDAIPEIALTAAPIARVGSGFAQAGRSLPKALARFAPAAGDIAANAGYSAGKAAYNGEDVANAAMYGGAGAAGGRVASKVLGNVANRVTTGMSPEARALLQRGITPTPGQAFGGLVERAENAATALPGFGSAVERAQARTGRQYAGAEINRALDPIEEVVKGSGRKAVDKANAIVDQSYNDVIPRTFLTADAAGTGLLRAGQEIEKIPLLTPPQQKAVLGYIQQKIVPVILSAKQSGTNIDGELAKRIDAEVGQYARKYAGSVNPADHPLGDAFYALQTNLRKTLQGVDETATAQLRATDAAYRNLIPINKAADRAGKAKGVFTPDQFRSAASRAGQKPGALNEAAGEVITPGSGGRLPRSVVGTGLSLAHLPAAAATYVGGSALGHVLYSEAGVKTMLGAMNLLPHIRQWAEGLPTDKQREFIMKMAKEVPSLHQLAAQVGREVATEVE